MENRREILARRKMKREKRNIKRAIKKRNKGKFIKPNKLVLKKKEKR